MVAGLMLANGLLAGSTAMAGENRLLLAFSTVGDSRQDPAYPDASSLAKDAKGNLIYKGVGNCPNPAGDGYVANPGLNGQDCKWLQNTAAWSKIIRGIKDQHPQLLFFNGDMTMGYGKAGVPVVRTSNGTGENPIDLSSANTNAVSNVIYSDMVQFYQQYAYWRGMVADLMETGTYVVPVPGNHETQCKRCGKKSVVENENAWRDNMGDLIIDPYRFNKITKLSISGFDATNAPIIPQDGVTTSQQQLSYSFDVNGVHFAVINTDPVGRDGHAPTTWLDSDLSKAKAAGAKAIFVFGHKPAYYYNYAGAAPSSTSSLSNADATAADAFWNVIVRNGATYFSGHEHEYNIAQYDGKSGQAGKAYQVIVGAGGSPWDAADPSVAGLKPSDRMYSWATVQVFQSGEVRLTSYGFNDKLGTTRVIEKVTLQTAK